jgi:hypothetical protein
MTLARLYICAIIRTNDRQEKIRLMKKHPNDKKTIPKVAQTLLLQWVQRPTRVTSGMSRLLYQE